MGLGSKLPATSLAIIVLIAGGSRASAQDADAASDKPKPADSASKDEDENKEDDEKNDDDDKDDQKKQAGEQHGQKKQDEGLASNASIARKLQNPIANLTSVPFQNNFDFGAGPGETTFGYTLNFQPVIPFPLGPRLNLISRTILPMISQPALVAGAGRKFGLGDITQSLFLSPKADDKLTASLGPAFLIPTATSDRLGSGKFGIGPTAVAVFVSHGWTLGVLANHIWSVAGSDNRTSVSNTFLQPFVARTFAQGFSVTAQTETNYDWKAKDWTVPLALGVSQVFKVEKMPVSIGLFVRYWVDKSPGSPDWSLRLPITFVLSEIGSARAPATAAAPQPAHPQEPGVE